MYVVQDTLTNKIHIHKILFKKFKKRFLACNYLINKEQWEPECSVTGMAKVGSLMTRVLDSRVVVLSSGS